MRGWIDFGSAAGVWGAYLGGWRVGLATVAAAAVCGALAGDGASRSWLGLWSCVAAAVAVAIAQELRSNAMSLRAGTDEARRQHEEVLASLLVKRQTATTDIAYLETQVQQIASLYQFSKTLSVALELEALMRTLGEAIHQQVRCGRCRLLLLDDRGQVEQVGEVRVSGEAPVIRPPEVEELSLASTMGQTGGPVGAGLGRDLTSGAVVMGVLPFVAVPLQVEQRTIGILVVEQLTPEAYRQLVSVARQLSLALKRSALYLLVQQLAITDGLTGLSVRRHVLQRLQEECSRSARLGQPLSVAMIDLDHFKAVNDSHGHLVGDAVLRAVAARVRRAVREIDLAGRYGGEEFIVVLPGADREAALQVAERVQSAVASEPVQAYDEKVSVTISVGLTTVSGRTIVAEEVVDRADRALYAAKTSGRNRVVTFESLP